MKEEKLADTHNSSVTSVRATLTPVGEQYSVVVGLDESAIAMMADVLTGAWSVDLGLVNAISNFLKVAPGADWTQVFAQNLRDYFYIALATRIKRVQLERRTSLIKDEAWFEPLLIQDVIKGVGKVQITYLGYTLVPVLSKPAEIEVKKLLDPKTGKIDEIVRFCELLRMCVAPWHILEDGVDYTNWEGDLAIMSASKGRVIGKMVTTGRATNVDDKTFIRSLVLDCEVDQPLKAALSGFIYRSVAEASSILRLNIASMTKLGPAGNR